MAYNVTVYKFAKRKNSTKRPTGSEAQETFACKLNDGSGILQPTFVFDFRNVLVNQPQDFNYAYVAEFNRYYFIDDWSYIDGLWMCKMTVDPLASWKSNIGSTSTYVHRCSHTNYKRYIDDKYPTIVHSEIKNVMNYGNFTGNTGNGCFILGIVGSTGSGGLGAVNYYVTTQNGFKALINKIFLNTSWLNITEITDELQKAMFNPIQYIASAYYFPFALSNISSKTGTGTVKFGWWDITGLSDFYILGSSPHVEMSIQFSIPKHPQSGTMGDWLNLNPYMRYTLIYHPYGQWDLDSTIMASYRTLGLAQTIDLISGRGTLYCGVYEETPETYMWFDSRMAQIAVPISMAQIASDITTATGGAVGFIGSLATGNVGSALTSAVSTASAMIPKATITGTNGGFNTYNLNVILQSQVSYVANENGTIFGYPYNDTAQISNIGGYIEAEPGNNAIPCTEMELEEINEYFRNGFYYE